MQKCVLIFSTAKIPLHGYVNSYVSCGSVVKLVNSKFPVRLHGPGIPYGAGSQQQSVTGSPNQIEPGSNWQIKGNTTKFCSRGFPIMCGQVIRLENCELKKNLHSHDFRSMLSNSQEVSLYGDDGDGDAGDDWKVVCSDEFWRIDDDVSFFHVGTKKYLEASGHQYPQPIDGHMEIIGAKMISQRSKWKASEGAFVHPPENWGAPPKHTEL
ncbi:unnamed protein product [Nesidiocoris tenuis]|uniref:MIR domain-containing protein n=1 Tax=Nesidiocoris tenuis TaxID=355587 RepID=A0A6H5G7L8_9HEMI|nr:unnamed protein product [Nesidiocoris tenuis]